MNVSYDHPFHVPLEYALNIDFVNETDGLSARVAVELTAESARHLMQLVASALEREETQVNPKESSVLFLAESRSSAARLAQPTPRQHDGDMVLTHQIPVSTIPRLKIKNTLKSG